MLTKQKQTEQHRHKNRIRQHKNNTTTNTITTMNTAQHITAGETTKKLSDTKTVTLQGQATPNCSVIEKAERAIHDDLTHRQKNIETSDLSRITITHQELNNRDQR